MSLSFCAQPAGVRVRVRHPDDDCGEHGGEVCAAQCGPLQRGALGEQGCLHALHRALHRACQGIAMY